MINDLTQTGAQLKSDYIKNNKLFNETLAILTFLREQTEQYEQQISQCLKRQKKLKQLIQDIEQQKSQLSTINHHQCHDETE